MSVRPHKLDLYRLAVQHPEAECAFFLKAWRHYAGARRGRQGGPTRLREDFAGTAAVAAAWVGLHEDHRALAVERDAATLRWARRRAARELGELAGDLHFVAGDVLRVAPPAVPRVDVVAALNFSTFIFHDRDRLREYFQVARAGLAPGGLLVIDAYGGPGALRLGEQRRPVVTPELSFEYRWEQRAYDAVTARVDCRIHFAWPGGEEVEPQRTQRAQRQEQSEARVREEVTQGRPGCRASRPRSSLLAPRSSPSSLRPSLLLRDAFCYDWRLWTLPELREVMREAGFRAAEVWCDRFAPRAGRSDGVYRPVRALPAREDWVAYVVGVR